MSTDRGHRVLVDLTAAQDAAPQRSEAALHAEAVALALMAVPGLVSGLLLHPRLPIPGGLHPQLLADPRLVWNTASQVRRLSAEGAVLVVIPDAGKGATAVDAMPAHMLSAGLQLLDGGFPEAAVLAVVELLRDGGGTSAVAPPLRVAVAEHSPGPITTALARRCVATAVDPSAAASAEFEPWAHAATIVHLQGRPGGGWLDRLALRHPCVLWMDGVDVEPDVLRRARAVVVPSRAAAQTVALRLGAGPAMPPMAVADPRDPGAAAAAIIALVEALSAAAVPAA